MLRYLYDQACIFWRRARGPRPKTGRGVYVDPTAQFLGAAQVIIDDHSCIGEDCWFNVNDRSKKTSTIIIGRSCFIGRRNFFTVSSQIVVGPYTMTGPDCHFLGANHSFADPWRPYVLGDIVPEPPLRLGSNCWLGASVILLPGVQVGFGSILGAGSVVTTDIGPCSLAVGNPAKVIKRYCFRRNKWVPISDWDQASTAALPCEENYLRHLTEFYPDIQPPAIASSGLLGNL